MKPPIFVLDSREVFEPVSIEACGAWPWRKLDFPPHPEQWAPDVQARQGGVGYYRMQPGGKLIWHQYWLFYLHNPKKYLGVGEHEGDWEFVQIGCVQDTPVCVTFSQHHDGDARMWWEVHKGREGRLVVFVALGSHANYALPGNFRYDEADGHGKVLADLDWRRFGEWATWGGRWGNSTGEGKSPQSPGLQGDRWHAPHQYHSRAAHT